MKEIESLKKYCEFILKQPCLTAEEEKKLFQSWLEGRMECRDKLVNSSLYLVIKEVWRNIDAHLSIWDMIQHGNLGILQAINKYDPKGQYIFKNVANIHIHALIRNAIGDESNTIRVPKNIFPLFDFVNRRRFIYEYDISEYTNEYKQLYDEEIDITEIQDILEIPFIKYNFDEFDVEWFNSWGLYNNELIRRQRMSDIYEKLYTISKRERIVIELYYGLNSESSLTLEEIGQKFNLTRERIRQIHHYAILRLRHATRSRFIRCWLNGEGNLTEISYKDNCDRHDQEYFKSFHEMIRIRKEIYWDIFWPILKITHTKTGLWTQEFVSSLEQRAKEFLNEEGLPQTYFAIYNDARIVFNEVPKSSLTRALKSSKDIVSIKIGTYALKEWGYVPYQREKKTYELTTKEVILNVLKEAGRPLTVQEIALIILEIYEGRCSNNKHTIIATIKRNPIIEQDMFGRYYLSKERINGQNITQDSSKI